MTVATLPSAAAIEKARFNPLTAAMVHSMPPHGWILKRVIPERGAGAIFGPSGSGKGFLLIDMVAAVGEGRDWFGIRNTKPRRCAILWLEGASAASVRIKAWEAENGRAFPDDVFFVFDAFDLRSHEDVLKLAAALHAIGCVEFLAIDTWNRAAPGSDENSVVDTGHLLSAVEALKDFTGAFIMAVHHAGKDATKGMRGHSSLHAALDVVIEVCRTDDQREWKIAKAKDGEDGKSFPFRLRSISLGEDEDGDPISSCCVAPIEEISEHTSYLLRQTDQRNADEAVLRGFRRLKAMGVHPTDGKTSPNSLPKQLLEKQLGEGFDRTQITDAMNRLMTRGVFRRDVIGKYGANRADQYGLVEVGA